MHTPEGTLERGQAPPPYSAPGYNTQFVDEHSFVPHLLSSLPNIKDECDNIATSMLRIQDELGNFSLHKSTSEPSVAVNMPQTCQDSSPDTPQPAYDLKQNWITGIFGCLRPVLSIIGKGSHEIRNTQDDWEIPFEQITDLNYLGCGGQGAVFSGKLNNEPVAVKKVSDIKETDIKNLRKLNHPNIVKFKGVCTQPPCYSIIMEFCPYGPLFNLLKNQKNVITTNRVVTWAKQIAGGMHYLHTHKIIHRDLKSPNVLIGDNEIIKISDFGTSRTWNGVSEKMSFAGTVAWMSPEAIQEIACSEKVDIWSFGIVLWELLTCEVPYDGMEQSAIMYLVGCGKLRPPIPTTCPEGFKLIMQMCWKMNPKERPSFKLICNHLEIAAVEILSKYKDDQFAETQRTWKKEIKSEITQFKAYMQKHKIDVQNQEEQLIKKREMEIKHIRDVRELYDRKLEKVNQLYLELAAVLQQVEQYRQGGRKREVQTKRRFINALMKKNERRKSNNQSTTPTSPEHSLTSPDSPQIIPPKAQLYVCMNQSSNHADSVTQTSLTSSGRSRKRHYRTNSGSPRNSGCSRNSSNRASTVVDRETQTDSMDVSENDLSPLSHSSSLVGIGKQPRRVILEHLPNESDDEGSNGNRVQLHYMVDHVQPVQVFTKMDSRSCSPQLLDAEDSVNRNTDTRYSDEDNLETIGRKVTALKNGNIFSDIRSSSENGNLTDDFGEALRKRVSSESRDILDSTEDAANDDSYTDEEGEVYNHTLRRKSSSRRPIKPGRRSCRYKPPNQFSKETNASDEGNTSEYSVSPSSKSSTLESNPGRPSNPAIKRPNQNRSDCSSDSSESEENLTIVTQVAYA